MSEDRIRKQMDKLGNTEFEWDELDIQMGEQIFLPVKTLNELRREAIALLEQELCTPTDVLPLILLLATADMGGYKFQPFNPCILRNCRSGITFI